MKKIYIVIPNWNGAEFISKCLRSLNAQTLKKHHMVIVDNGSSDNSLDVIKKNFSDVTVLEFSNNAGFAGGVNRGIRFSLEQGADYIALLNNDAVVDKHWLGKLVAQADEHQDAGIVTSKILLDDKKHIDSTGDFYTIWGMPFPRGRNQVDKGQFDDQIDVFGASGGASLYRAELFRQIGLFDEDFFAYYEDVDISFRAQMAGWKVRYQPKAVVYHGLSKTSSKLGDFARYHSAKNFLLLYARNMPTKLYWKYLPLFALQLGRMCLTSIARRKFSVFLKGSWAAVRMHGKTRIVRKKNLALQKVDTNYIDSMLTHSRPPRIPKL